MGLAPPPGCGSVDNPKLLFKLAPSICRLLNLPSLPAKLLPLLACGVSLVKSVILLDIEGNVVICLELNTVLAPVLALAALLPPAVIVTSFNTVELVERVISVENGSPRFKETSLIVCGVYPTYSTVIAYGPPTLVLGIVKFPSFF